MFQLYNCGIPETCNNSQHGMGGAGGYGICSKCSLYGLSGLIHDLLFTADQLQAWQGVELDFELYDSQLFDSFISLFSPSLSQDCVRDDK